MYSAGGFKKCVGSENPLSNQKQIEQKICNKAVDYQNLLFHRIFFSPLPPLHPSLTSYYSHSHSARSNTPSANSTRNYYAPYLSLFD